MTTVTLDYDAEDDWLDVGFGRQDGIDRSIALNDHITVYTDSTMIRITRITFGEYARLLMVNETEFTALRDEDQWVREDILFLLMRPPASRLLNVIDPEALIARVLSPSLQDLFES